MEHEKTTRCRKSQIFRPQPLTAQLLKIPAKSPVMGDLRSFPCNFTIFRSLTYEKPRLPDEVSECTSLQNQWPFLMGKLTICRINKFPQLPQFFASTAQISGTWLEPTTSGLTVGTSGSGGPLDKPSKSQLHEILVGEEVYQYVSISTSYSMGWR
jgi:hypothetical protein